MLGLDDVRKFSNITFKNCYYNGKWMGSFEDGNFLYNKYVQNILFILDNVKHQISLSVNDISGGTASGGGNYTHGVNATIFANPSNGYIFTGWTEGSNTISANPQYTFPVVNDIQIKAIFSISTSITNISDNPNRFYPNPATDKLYFNFTNQHIDRIQFFDVTGKLVYTNKGVGQTESIDLSGFARGLYIVQVYAAKDVFTTKVTINRN
jgi:hypothetical protein